MKKAYLLLLILSILILGGCSLAEEEKTEEEPFVQEKTMATIKTNYGNIKLELFFELAPKTVDNFVSLAESGFYNNTKFHRVIKGFMIQGGDPLTKDDSKKELWGTGGPDYMFEDEIHSENHNIKGTIAMANRGVNVPNSNGSQFFINTADNNYLDSMHTVFGKVVEGMDVVLAIEGVDVEGPNRPVENVVVKTIEIEK